MRDSADDAARMDGTRKTPAAPEVTALFDNCNRPQRDGNLRRLLKGLKVNTVVLVRDAGLTGVVVPDPSRFFRRLTDLTLQGIPRPNIGHGVTVPEYWRVSR